MQRLRKINARLADDEGALRTLLLVAIRDEDFECVRDGDTQPPSGVDGDVQKRKRIRLNKSCRIVSY
jgi:hypothetical protein